MKNEHYHFLHLINTVDISKLSIGKFIQLWHQFQDLKSMMSHQYEDLSYIKAAIKRHIEEDDLDTVLMASLVYNTYDLAHDAKYGAMFVFDKELDYQMSKLSHDIKLYQDEASALFLKQLSIALDNPLVNLPKEDLAIYYRFLI